MVWSYLSGESFHRHYDPSTDDGIVAFDVQVDSAVAAARGFGHHVAHRFYQSRHQAFEFPRVDRAEVHSAPGGSTC